VGKNAKVVPESIKPTLYLSDPNMKWSLKLMPAKPILKSLSSKNGTHKKPFFNYKMSKPPT